MCTLHTADGRQFVIRAAVRGRLLEVNERLTAPQAAAGGEESAGLLSTDSEWGGYVCIVLMDKPQLYDLIDNTDSRYATKQTWQQTASNTNGDADRQLHGRQ